MYYIKVIEDKIRVPPNMFGSDLEDAILRILRENYERRIVKDVGIVLSVDSAKVISEGTILPGDSGAYYGVKFDALTFTPYVNEVYEADIKEVVEFGAFAGIGPIQGLVHISQVSPDKFFYDKKAKNLSTRTSKRSLKKDDRVLLKVSTVSMRSNTTETKIGLTMRADGLGKEEWMNEKAAVQKPKKTKKEEEKT